MSDLKSRDERGEVAVEYAIVAAALIAVAVALGVHFPTDIFAGWLEAARGVIFVSVNDPSDAGAVIREIGRR